MGCLLRGAVPHEAEYPAAGARIPTCIWYDENASCVANVEKSIMVIRLDPNNILMTTEQRLKARSRIFCFV